MLTQYFIVDLNFNVSIFSTSSVEQDFHSSLTFWLLPTIYPLLMITPHHRHPKIFCRQHLVPIHPHYITCQRFLHLPRKLFCPSAKRRYVIGQSIYFCIADQYFCRLKKRLRRNGKSLKKSVLLASRRSKSYDNTSPKSRSAEKLSGRVVVK